MASNFREGLARAVRQHDSMDFGSMRAMALLTPDRLRVGARALDRQAEQREALADYMEAEGIESLTPGQCRALIQKEEF